MSLIPAILLALAAVPVTWVAVSILRARAQSARLRAGIDAAEAPRDVSDRLPAPVRDFALRADARPTDLARSVSLYQMAELRLGPDKPWMPIEARQWIAIGAPGFVWQARQAAGPVTRFRVVDAFVRGAGVLTVRLLGWLKVAEAKGPALDRGEAMRYLAELPWAPDAILGNPALTWRMAEPDWAEVTLALPDGPASVRFRFDQSGDIAEVFGAARPATDAQGNPVLLDWCGFFRDYRMIGPRRLPAEAEVGYLYPEGYRPYFTGRITAYDARH